MAEIHKEKLDKEKYHAINKRTKDLKIFRNTVTVLKSLLGIQAEFLVIEDQIKYSWDKREKKKMIDMEVIK